MTVVPSAWLAEALVASTLLMVAVLALRNVVTPLFGARIAYVLWALPVLRMVLPPLPRHESDYIPSGLDLSVIHQITPPPLAASMVTSASGAPAVGGAPIDWGLTLLAVWAIGAVAHFAWHLVAYRIFLAKTAGVAAPLYDIAGVGVYSADVSGPAAAGVFLRRILLPRDFAERFEEREQRLALAHELAHHRRGDLLANWIALILLSLHWFNPVAHAAYRAFRDDQELACDATVLKTSSSGQLHAYASAIVKATWDRSVVAACPLNHAGQLKRRLKMMQFGRKTLFRTVSGLVLTTTMVGGGLAMTASGSVVQPPAVANAIDSLMAAPAAMVESGRTQLETFVTARGVQDALTDDTELSVITLPKARLLPDQMVDIPVVQAPAVSADRTIHFSLVGSSEQHVVPASKAAFMNLLQGHDAAGEPLELQRISIGGLSREEAAALSAKTRAAGGLPEAASALAQTDALLFEGKASGRSTFTLQIAWEKPAPVAEAATAAEPSLPSAEVLRDTAILARKHLSGVSYNSAFRQVYATVVPGAFNTASPGRPFIGFCGELNTRSSRRDVGWKPFFVANVRSTTGSSHLIMNEQLVAARCKGARSAENYARVFRGAVPKSNEVMMVSQRGPVFDVRADQSYANSAVF